MTAPKPMTRQELVELAALDALGLLDDYEASLYTRSFHHAPSAVQDELVELQAQIAADPCLMATEDPDDSLRDRVLETVAAAIENDTPDLTPLATIGGTRLQAVGGVNNQTIATGNPDIIGRIRSTSAFWRVAAFALCGMVIVMAYLLSVSVSQQSTLARLALGNNTDAQLEQMIGPTAKDYLFDHTSMRIVLTSPDGAQIGRAMLWIQEGTDEALLVMELPHTTGEVYELSIQHADGTSQHLARFDGKDRLTGLRVAVDTAALSNGATLQINGPNGFLLVSA
jgi:hypothetical protein